MGGLSWEGNDTVMTLVSSTSCVKFEDTVSEYNSSPELTADEGYEADIEIRDQLSEQVLTEPLYHINSVKHYGLLISSCLFSIKFVVSQKYKLE